MRGWSVLLVAAALGTASVSIDPCKRQPFRGRCSSINGEAPKRSQFVLRYYMRNSECVSYPFGHCANDPDEPKLYRYKEECEDACISSNSKSGTTSGSNIEQTSTTVSQNSEKEKIAKMEFLDTNLKPSSEEPKPPSVQPTTTEPSTTISSSSASTTTSTYSTVRITTTTSKASESTTTPQTTTTRYSTTTTTTQKTTTPEPRSVYTAATTMGKQKTECETRRAAASSASIKGGFVPACTASGEFEKIQCEPDGRQCFCVNERGIEMPNTRTNNGEKPDCEKIQSVSTSQIAKDCSGAPMRGPCQSYMTRFYYDENDQKCKKFTYSGCGGTGNNYETQTACESRCAPPPIGLARCEKGEPLKTSIGVPVNCAKERCPPDYKCSVVQQSSVCCPDTVKTPVGEQTFSNSDACNLPKERGPCDKYELRFYFNPEIRECKYFFWGGCGGNGNNFESANACEATCLPESEQSSEESREAENSVGSRYTQRPFTIRTTQGIRITPNGPPSNASDKNGGQGTTASRRTTTYRTYPTTTRRTTTQSTTRRTATSTPRTLPTRSRQTTTTVNEDEYEEGEFEEEGAENGKNPPPAEPLPVPAIPDAILLEGSPHAGVQIGDGEVQRVNRCLHPKDPGPCKGSFVRWYWNADKKFCDVFTYNGCGGNGNNFASREECLAICHKEVAPVVVPDFTSVCNNDVDAGECNGVFQRFAFDTETGECRPFTYGGCGGNGNNFATMSECRNRCEKDSETTSSPCDNEIEIGECSQVFARFGYDKTFNDCRQFTYGGCGGNGNNFPTIQECRKTCVKKPCPPTPQCDLSRCQLVNDRNGCPFCSCPPIKQSSGSGNCPAMNAADCEEPCIIITNRSGCQECKCPAETSGPEGPSRITGSRVQTTRVPTRQDARPPASSSASAGPPSPPSSFRPQAPGTNARANSAKTIPGIDKNSIPLSNLPDNISNNIKEKCLQPVDPGPCNHFIERWYFNTASGHCQNFNYGGCAGNHNHFFTQKECEIHCARFLKSIGTDEAVSSEEDGTKPLSPAGDKTDEALLDKSPVIAGTRTRIVEPVAPPQSENGAHPPGSDSSTVSPTTTPQASSTSQIPKKTTTVVPSSTEDPLKKAVFANHGVENVDIDPAFAHLQDITQLEDKYPREKVIKETLEVKSMQEAELRPRTHGVKTDAGEKQQLKRIEIAPRGTLTHQHIAASHDSAPDKAKSVTRVDTPSADGNDSTPQITGTNSEFDPPPAPVLISTGMQNEDEAMADLSDWSLEQHNGNVAPPGGFPEVNAAGRSIFEPDETLPDPTDLVSAGREPVPRRPTGIAQAPVPELKDLEAPTTKIPTATEAQTTVAQSSSSQATTNNNVKQILDPAVICNQPPDAGTCSAYVPRWFYNAQSGQCEQFSYGSCGGNLNNFADRSDCEQACISSRISPTLPQRCQLEKNSGSGKGYHVKWYFNMKNLRCEQFVYEGQEGNDNRFERLADCEAICTAPKTGVIKQTTASVTTTSEPTAPTTESESDSEYEEKETGDDADLTQLLSGAGENVLPEAQQNIDNVVSGKKPLPPAAQGARTHRKEESGNKKEYKAEPISAKLKPLSEPDFASANLNQPVVAPSPPVEIDYTLGGRKVQPARKAHGLPNFNGQDAIDFTDGKPDAERMLSCPNGRLELKYPDGRPVNCLPGKNQCPERSVCYFNGLDFFCCPNDDDPYDKHVFGGYDGEEAKHGYKIFGKLNIRRLMDEVPLRARRRRATSQRFDMDSAVAPMRFDSETKPHTVSRALRMKPKAPTRGNPMCIEPVIVGSCAEAHLRYFYDRGTDTCRLFHYSGCDGNGNNFGSLEDCQRLCVLNFEGLQDRLAEAVENEAETTTTTRKPAPPGKCPDDATPLGGSAPVLCGNSTESIACPEGYYCSGGPPDICCPVQTTEQQKEEAAQHFSPYGFIASQSNLPRGFSRHTFLSPPKFMCPDASDPMMDPNGQPVQCGAGFDGMKLCPRGYYCAIDSEKNSRLCCPLFGQASRIPAEEMAAPYYKKQKVESRERKRMPASIVEDIEAIATDDAEQNQQSQIKPAELPAAAQEEEQGDMTTDEYQDEPGEFKHLKIKTENPEVKNETIAPTKEASNEEVSIDLGASSSETKLQEETSNQKESLKSDKSICQLKPSEGRACREDEKPPRTNLHYFYSPKDRRCKLYFYRGCGGNENRFEKKADCEALCS